LVTQPDPLGGGQACPTPLQLASDLELPLDVVTRRTAIVGQTGTGKTSTAVVLAEEAAAAGARFVVIDPTGAWYGLKSNAAGDGPGVDCVVMGGHHGDVPLDEHSGQVVGELVANEGYNLVLDLDRVGDRMASWGARQRFVADFLSALYENAHSQVLVIFDEAHRFAPQVIRDESGHAARCLGAVIDVVALGRRKGLAAVVVTQRLARLHKDVLELCEIMVAHRLRGTNDRKALQGWIEEAGQDVKVILARSLRARARRARVSAPTLGIDGVYMIRPKRTFDSSASIEVGEAAIEPKVRSQVDLGALERLMADTLERQREDRPEGAARDDQAADRGASRRRARSRMRFTASSSVATDVVVAHRDRIAELETKADALRGYENASRAAVRQALVSARGLIGALEDVDGHALADYAGDAGPADEPRGSGTPHPGRHTGADDGRGSRAERKPIGQQIVESIERETNGHGPTLKAGHLRILEALSRYRDRGLTRTELVPLASFESKRTVGDYIAYLKGVAYVTEAPDGHLALTDAGLERLGPDAPRAPLTRDDLYARRQSVLKAGHRRMLEALFKAHPDGFTRKELARLVDMNDRTAGDYVAHLKKHVLVDERNRRIYAGYVFYLGAEVAA
jgi:hypothetical protein